MSNGLGDFEVDGGSRHSHKTAGISPKTKEAKDNRILRLHHYNNKTDRNYLVPRIASLAALATRNLTTLLALILMVSPVAGFRPMRALRFTRTILPSPGIVKLFLAFLYARATRASRICTPCFLVRPTVSASEAAICDLDNAFWDYEGRVGLLRGTGEKCAGGGKGLV